MTGRDRTILITGGDTQGQALLAAPVAAGGYAVAVANGGDAPALVSRTDPDAAVLDVTLKKTLQWLTRALRALIRAAVELLKAVLSLVQAVSLALFEGPTSRRLATGQGAAFVARVVTEGAKSLLLKVAQGVVSTLDAKSDGHQSR
jgi:hypothetical protein